jgi:hypothetical protein
MKKTMTIQLGQDITGRPMLLTGNPNYHICSQGKSGTGKTTFNRNLTIALVDQNGRVVIFDFTGDYQELTQLDGAVDVKVIDMRNPSFSLPLFEPEFPDDTPVDIAGRVVSLLHNRLKFGDSQLSYLSELITEGLENGTIHTFDDLVSLVELEEVHKNVSVRLLPKLYKINRLLPKGADPTFLDLDTPGITILDFHRISDPASLSILVEFLVGTICGRRMNQLPKDDPHVFLLIDELHRLKLTESSNIARLLREGRKYNLHGVFSTQWIKNRTEASILEQTAAQVYFCMGDREAAQTISNFAIRDRSMRERYLSLLTGMPRGQFLLRHNNHFYISKAPRITQPKP